MPLTRKTVMISSTARDLPEHRKEVMNACLSQGMFPVMMEHLPANDDDAISASLKMVDEADIYVGIFAQRYGYIPKGKKRNPKQISITEMEYNHAVKRKIPCLLFVMDKSHPITIDDIDMENAVKLQKFKDRIQTKTVVNFFKSPAELRAQVLNSLSKQIESAPVTIPDREISTIDVTAYYNALRKRYNVLALEGLTPPQKEEYLQIQLRSVFVEQSVREDTPPVELPKEVWEKLSREKEIHEEDLPSGITLDDVRKARESYYQKPSQLVLDALADKGNKYTLILGDPGSGKSTLTRYVILTLIDPALAEDKTQKAFEGYLPLLVELRAFVGACADGKCETPLEFLEYLGKTEGWGLTQSALHNHLKNDGRAVVVFDGLDEIFEPKLRETITNQIVGFTNAYSKARVIVTSRILGYRRKILSDAGFKHFTLQDLDEKQVETFIIKWYELAMSDRPDEAKERIERILNSFANSPSIRQLAGNPMLLTIMAIIGKHQELPRERWKLYDHAASVLIQHWDVNKHLKDESIEADFIGEDDKKELLRRLAYRMQSGDGGLAGNYIHREGLQEEFESYLKERYSQMPDRAKIIAEAMIQQFRERNFILSLYGANLYGFVHRAFLEFFCASAFVWKFEKTKELDIEYLKTNVYGKHWEDQSWHEVLRLICGMIDERWVYEISTYLENLHSVKKDIKFISGFGTEVLPNKALSIECLGEVKHTQISYDLITKYFDDADTLAYVFFVLGFRIREYPNTEKILKHFVLTHSDRIFRAYCLIVLAQNFHNDIRTFLFLRERVAQDDDFNVRSAAVLALAEHYREDAETIPLLRDRALNDTDAYVRSSAVDALGQNFKEDAETISLLRDRALNDTDARVRSSAVRALGQNFKEDADTLPLLRDWAVNSQYADVRSSAVRVLGQNFKEDADTLPLLRDCAVNDTDADVRSSAVRVLEQNFKEDAETLLLLRDWAVNSQYADVRSSAVDALGQNFKEDAETLPLLRDWAVNSQYADVRSSAVDALWQNFKEDAETLLLLQDWAVNSQYADVRSSAVRVLGRNFKEDAETLPLLRDRALNDESPKLDDKKEKPWSTYVRDTAIEAIVENWHDHPETLQLLRDRAENDPTPWLRERCKELIEEIDGKKT